MMSEETNLIFQSDSEIDLQNSLSKYGVTPNQAKVFIHLGKSGSKTAPEISKNLKLPRTETYQILKVLQHKGIVTATFEKPSRFEALPFDQTMLVLVNNERDRVRELETQQKKLLDLWKSIPTNAVDRGLEKENRFQILQGKSPVLGKLKSMISGATKEIAVLGSEKDFVKFYHSDFFEFLKESKVEKKILTSGSEETQYVFEEIPIESIKRFNDRSSEEFCFVIIDEKEVMFFIKPESESISDIMAVWADSRTLINSLKLLFTMIWSRSNSIHSVKKTEQTLDYNHGIREIEQERLILEYVHRHIPKPKTRKRKK